MPPPRKPDPKKAPAPRKAPPRPAARRKKRATSRPGPDPLVLRTFKPGPDGIPDPTWWSTDSPAGQVLAALAIGATWYHASHFARLHERTALAWNTRGQELLADHDDYASYADSAPDDEHRAYAAFALAAAAARHAPVVGALQTIDRARKAGDWKAAAHQLRVLPAAAPYSEAGRTSVSVAAEGPVQVTVNEAAVDSLMDLVGRIVDETEAES